MDKAPPAEMNLPVADAKDESPFLPKPQVDRVQESFLADHAPL